MSNKNALKQDTGKTHSLVPANMGKGLLYDSQTKTYYVAIDEKMFQIDELGKLKLRVSSLEDNMLKLRDDGLYQGNTARSDLANIYVANHGNDSNAGTREAPLRTIQEAINRAENIPAYYHIWLHEGHEFDWVYGHKAFPRWIFDVYGDTVDSTYPMSIKADLYYRGYTAKNFPRPTINVRVNHVNDTIYRQFLAGQEAIFRGIRIDLYNKFEGVDDGSLSGRFNGFIDCTDTVTFHGCILNEKTKAVSVGSGAGAYRDDVAFRVPRILWIDSLAETMPRLVSSTYTTQLSLISWNNDTIRGYGEKPDHEALIKSATAFQDMSRGMRNAIFGVVFDDSTKTILGMNLNWDIFTMS